MESFLPLRLLPTMPMLAESLKEAGWDCQMAISDEKQSYRVIRLYHQRQVLQKDVLYLLRPDEQNFPVDRYAYLSAAPHPGKANHLIIPRHPDEEILDQLLEVFSQFQSWEDSINLLLYRNASLQELCELAARLLENPVCIHDDWFMLMAATAEFTRIMEPEYLLSSTKGFVPRAVVEDFQTDSDFLETYAYRDAHLWDPPEKTQKSLYVNLWDGQVYKGRLLVAPKNRDFLQRDFLLAEALTQRATMLLRRKQPGEEDTRRNMDDIIFALLQDRQIAAADLQYMADMLRWNNTDRFVCVRVRFQRNDTSLQTHMLHSELFRVFPNSYILLDGHSQCVVINVTRNPASLAEIRYRLSPLCRDYGLYVGISSPAQGLRELNVAYLQAGEALDRCFHLHNEKWLITFPECALDYLINNLPAPLSPAHLVAPELTVLMEYDRENGTQYFDTFREYLLRERDIPGTSRALIIHRTTLLYRLKKIQSLIPVNLEDPWQRLYLVLSLWLLGDRSGKPLI